jgi:ribosomal protein S18 acetylase RimI-like enzyme
MSAEPAAPGWAVRALADADVPGAIDLWHRAGVARPWNDPAKDIAFARASPHAAILAAEDAGRIVGTAMVGEDGHRGWVYYVAVDPDLQRGGLGRALMDAAEDWLRARGIWKLQLLVRADNERARGFYARLGYRDTGSVCFQKVIAEA